MTESVFKASTDTFQNLKSFYCPVIAVLGYTGSKIFFLVLIIQAMSAQGKLKPDIQDPHLGGLEYKGDFSGRRNPPPEK